MASEKRLIDAEELWKKFESEPWYDNADRDEIALPMVDDAPTVNAVEVVRCKDCVFHKKDTRSDFWFCDRPRMDLSEVKPEDFCSYGWRKNDHN